MNKIVKQFMLVGVLIGASGTGLYTYYLDYINEPISEMSRYHAVKEQQEVYAEQLRLKIEQGLVLPSSSDGAVYYNENTGTNIIITSDNEMHFD